MDYDNVEILLPTEYYSAPKSITDSPLGDYPENATRIITLNNSISLENCRYARIIFLGKMGY